MRSARFLVLYFMFLGLSFGGTKLLRFPDIYGDQVVFVHGGDLWKSPAAGGTATRLTAHPGLELFPKFSPDGKWIAFTGQYDGDEQVYVMPAGGGVPKQLTYYPARGPLPDRWGFDHQVYGWSPDSQRVLFRSTREYWGPAEGRLYTVSIDGGLPAALPMPASGAGDFGPDGTSVVYSPLFRDFRTWKRYEGGWAQDLYIFYPATNETRRVTNHIRTDRDPMWLGDAIFFASDRGGSLELYRFDLKTNETKKVTSSGPWDVRWPSSDGDRRIVYELDGELQVFDAKNNKTMALDITVPDDGLYMRPHRTSAEDLIEDAELSPKGERAVFVARGDVFSVPIEKGYAQNLTNSSGAHDRLAVWSPDGRSIAYISDKTGEEQVWVIDHEGAQPARRLTDGVRGRLNALEWAPDSKKIAFSDSQGRIWALTVEDKTIREVADESWGQVNHYKWSPDSQWLAFSLQMTERTRAIHLWNEKDNQVRKVTGDLFDEYQPVWDPEGNYLFYFSDRSFAPQISAVEWNYAGDRMTGVFAMALRKDVKHPFPPESDEVKVEEDKKDDAKKDDEEKEGAKEPKPLAIDFDGLAERVARVPVEAENYGWIAAKKGHLLLIKSPPFYYGRAADQKTELQIFSMEDRKLETLVEAVTNISLSHDGEKTLVRAGASWALYDAKPKGKDSKKAVSTKGLMADVTPKQEWDAIFDEVWRRYRDFFYAENMHGNDWEKLRAQYRPWLGDVAHRWDLNYVIGEMISELSVGHAYILGGDYEIPDRPKVALPGAEFELDEPSGRYRIKTILTGQNEEDEYRAPLTEIGVDARPGDYILAIDGEELRAPLNPYKLLRNKADRPVTLTLSASADGGEPRQTQFRPITDESNLRYLDWVAANRRQVDEATNGEVGYLHIPDMGAQGIYEWIKYFYPQMRKKGLVIDVRGNGGGNVSQMILARLERKLLGTRFSRNNEHAATYPETVFHGHMVCLISENSASDGDIFPARFQKAGLGPLIGKRTWGGVVGITNRGPLLDGGTVFVPEFATNDVDGSYIIENKGVSPDIEVENDPASVIAGKDPQLERGIEEVMRKIREQPMELPKRPADPVKTR
jgi:tricorn protease